MSRKGIILSTIPRFYFGEWNAEANLDLRITFHDLLYPRQWKRRMLEIRGLFFRRLDLFGPKVPQVGLKGRRGINCSIVRLSVVVYDMVRSARVWQATSRVVHKGRSAVLCTRGWWWSAVHGRSIAVNLVDRRVKATPTKVFAPGPAWRNRMRTRVFMRLGSDYYNQNIRQSDE